MTYARTTFAAFACLFLLGLGIFSFFQNPKSLRYRLFALYCFCNFAWNLTDFVILILDPTLGLIFYRVTGVAACFITPTLLHFVYLSIQIMEEKLWRRVVTGAYVTGAILAILSPTPLIFKNIIYKPFHSGITEVPGLLYPLFCLLFFSTLVTVGIPIPGLLKKAKGIRRLQLLYLLLAVISGTAALLTFLLSYLGHDWPWAYYPLQSLTSFFFAFAIFRYDLIPASLAMKRAMLLLGIYVAIGMALIPVVFWFNSSELQGTLASLPALVAFVFAVGALFSVGPLAYSKMIHRYSLFQDSVASQLTHEFKTPLAAIQSARATLEEAAGDPSIDPRKLRDYVAIIERNTARLEKFVCDILDFNRVKDISSGTQMETVDIRDICRTVLLDFQGRNIQVTGSTTNLIQGSTEGLRQVLSNLIGNAIKFCPDGLVEVSISEDESRLQVSVQDQGVGIPPENLEKIFQPFFKTPSPHHIAGNGLGLAIVKQWIDFHNGTIWAESEGEGKGTKISFTLPLI